MSPTEQISQRTRTSTGRITPQDDPEMNWLLNVAPDSVDAAMFSHDFNEHQKRSLQNIKLLTRPRTF